MNCKITERVLKDRNAIYGEKREREEHDTKNTKRKEKKKLMTGSQENKRREEILVEEGLVINNDEKKEVIIKTIKTKKERQFEQDKTGQQPMHKEVIANQ